MRHAVVLLAVEEHDEVLTGEQQPDCYDKDDEEWVPVETTVEDGYLEAETDEFSTWTILIPDTIYTIILIGIGIGVAVLIAIVVVVIKKKRK